MNKRYVLYSIMAIVIIGIVATVIGYTTDLRPIQTIEQPATVSAPVPVEATTSMTIDTSTGKKKPCECCAERKTRLEKKIQETRARKRAKQQAQTVAASQ